jgi:superfamily I DNA/RNA helicase
VSRLLHRLVNEERVSPEDIAVLTGRPSRLGQAGQVGAIRVTADQDQEPGRVLLQTVHRFKGLERRVVILTEIDTLPDGEREAILYVGLSRARTHLVVIATAETLGELRLPNELARPGDRPRESAV